MHITLTIIPADVLTFLGGMVAGAILVLISGKRISGTPTETSNSNSTC